MASGLWIEYENIVLYLFAVVRFLSVSNLLLLSSPSSYRQCSRSKTDSCRIFGDLYDNFSKVKGDTISKTGIRKQSLMRE